MVAMPGQHESLPPVALPPLAAADCTWPELLVAWIAADTVLQAGLLQAMEASPTYHLAMQAWGHGVDFATVRRLLLQAAMEALARQW